MMKLLFAIFLPTLCPLFAQNVALPITIGYTEPAPFQVGARTGSHPISRQHLLGRRRSSRSAVAGPGDLPQSLAGISVRITTLDGTDLIAPIFAVDQKQLCGLSGLQAGDAGCLLTRVKMQIPFEVPGDLVRGDQGSYKLPPPALISIDVDGRRGRGFPLQPVPDNAHVLTTCDASWDTSNSSICDRGFHERLG